MGFGNDLKAEVIKIFKEQWEMRHGSVVPEDNDLKLANDAVRLDAVVLYADISSSTGLVDDYTPTFAAEVYKTYLYCAAKVIRAEGGVITAYDGDRVMAIYIGGSKNSSAARTALKINYCVQEIINPAIEEQYPDTDFVLRHVVGVDSSSLFVARTGVRGANDLVWVGRAANYAAKMSSLSDDYPSRITASVYGRLNDSLKFSKGRPMWEKATWTKMGIIIYRSTWWWNVG